MNVRNIDDCPYSKKHGMYGGASGDKDGVIIDGEDWLVKYPKNAQNLARHEEMLYTNDPASEYIGSHIYAILGYPVHETELVERRGKVAVACKDFEEDGKRLIELRTIKNASNDKLEEELERTFSSTGDTHGVDYEKILLHLQYNDILIKIDGLKERFWDMVVVDAYINNSDRNNGNWGIIREAGQQDRLAPIYDNGGSFNGKTPDSRLERMLGNTQVLKQSVLNCNTSFFGSDGKVISLKDMFDSPNKDLSEALIRNVPKIQAHKQEIINLINSIPEQVCSNVRKTFYCTTLDIRLKEILEPAYEKAIALTQDEPNHKMGINQINLGDNIMSPTSLPDIFTVTPAEKLEGYDIQYVLDLNKQNCIVLINNETKGQFAITKDIGQKMENFFKYMKENTKTKLIDKDKNTASRPKTSLSNDER